MTDLEIEARRKAEEVEKRQKRCRYNIDESYIIGYEDGYMAGAESREKIIAELKAQIEKMKECANCPVWLLNQSEKNCKDCKYKGALILLRR